MALSNKTYNNVVNFLARLAEYHEQIESVSVGDIFDINLEKMQLFPLLHINPVNVTTGQSELTYNFQIFIMDLVSEKNNWQTFQAAGLTKMIDFKNNEQQVFNQTLAIATDFIGMLRHSKQQSLAGVNDINNALYFTQGEYTIEPFSERFDNLCCGQVFQVGVEVMNDFQTCDIPVTPEGAGY